MNRMKPEPFHGLPQSGSRLWKEPLAKLHRAQLVQIRGLTRLGCVGLFQLHQSRFITTHTQQLTTNNNRNDGEQTYQAQQVGLGQQIHRIEVSSWLR